jgi:hypothetical protein
MAIGALASIGTAGARPRNLACFGTLPAVSDAAVVAARLHLWLCWKAWVAAAPIADCCLPSGHIYLDVSFL